MKKVLLLLTVSSLLPMASVFSQTLSDYVKQVKRRHSCHKNVWWHGGKPDALYYTLLLDTSNVPAGRVYELQAGGWYPCWIIHRVPQSIPTVIVGSDPTMVLNNRMQHRLPIDFGYAGSLTNTGYISANRDLTIRIGSCSGANDGPLGWDVAYTMPLTWNWFSTIASWNTPEDICAGRQSILQCDLQKLLLCQLDRTANAGLAVSIRCFANLDTLLVENCTPHNASWQRV